MQKVEFNGLGEILEEIFTSLMRGDLHSTVQILLWWQELKNTNLLGPLTMYLLNIRVKRETIFFFLKRTKYIIHSNVQDMMDERKQ